MSFCILLWTCVTGLGTFVACMALGVAVEKNDLWGQVLALAIGVILFAMTWWGIHLFRSVT